MSDLNDRQRQIMEQLRASGQQSINELAAEFGVATQTIRRDINDLCDQGLARRVHGGVAPPSNPLNLNFHARATLNEDRKRAIANAAAALIPEGSTVLLGIGTTVQYVAEALTQTPELPLEGKTRAKIISRAVVLGLQLLDLVNCFSSAPTVPATST